MFQHLHFFVLRRCMFMIKLLLGGSPCTKWSIAQQGNRETQPKGVGWELFRNYVIAKERFKPDYFLYENNMSTDKQIIKKIEKELQHKIMPINSAIFSAQTRDRFYVHNVPNVTIPKDKGILLKDILEYGEDLLHREKAYCLTASYEKTIPKDTIHRHKRSMVAVKVGRIGNNDAQANRVYSTNAKSVSLTALGGGAGAKTGLYAVPVSSNNKTINAPIYTVNNGSIVIDGVSYNTPLEDGYYMIRKLTVTEAKRLQTVPDEYKMPCSTSQNFRMLGNGWTVDVIAHILSFIPNIKTEDVIVLSMYDGMSCGHIALDKIGANVVQYYATEIDKYCIETTQVNYPNTIQLGNAMYVRNELFWYNLEKMTHQNGE